MTRIQHTARGQAMTEFVIAASTILVALFLLMPLLGKLLDLGFHNQMMARYVTWERTVWFDFGEEPEESTNAYVAERSDSEIVRTAQNRVLHSNLKAFKPVTEADLAAPTDAINPLWTYGQSKQSMVQSNSLPSGSLSQQDTPSLAYDVLDTINDGLQVVTAPIDFMLSLVGGSNENFLEIGHSFQGYYQPTVNTRLNTAAAQSGTEEIEHWVFESGWDGTFTARGAIIADGWNAQSPEMYEGRVNDFVPSTVFDNDLIDAFIDVAGIFEPSLNDLDFGWVGTNPVPIDDPECNMGFCEFP